MFLVLLPLLHAGTPPGTPPESTPEPPPAATPGTVPATAPAPPPAANPWEADVARLLAAPEHAEARLVVLREQMLAVSTDAASRDRLRAVGPVVTALDAGPPLPLDARVAVFTSALVDGAEAGRKALAAAQEAAENDPATVAADAWIGPLLDALLAADSHEGADALLEAAANEHADTTAITTRVGAARVVLEVLPVGAPSQRAKARPLLERAFSRRSSERAAVVALVSSFDGQLELLRLGVYDADAILRRHALAITDAYWYVCGNKRTAPRWHLVADDLVADAGRRAKREAHRYAFDQCRDGEYLTYDASWTITMGGEPALGTQPLLHGPLRPALDQCATREVQIDVDYRVGPSGMLQEVAVTAPAPTRPPDCLEREDAVRKVAAANAELERRVAEVKGP